MGFNSGFIGLSEEQEFSVFENRVLMKKFGPKRDEGRG